MGDKILISNEVLHSTELSNEAIGLYSVLVNSQQTGEKFNKYLKEEKREIIDILRELKRAGYIDITININAFDKKTFDLEDLEIKIYETSQNK